MSPRFDLSNTRHLPWLFVRDGLGDGCDVVGGVAAAAAGEVEQASVGEVRHVIMHVLGLEIEAGGRERVGQAGIRVA